MLTGGGAKVDVGYRLLQGGDYTRTEAELDARESGHTPLTLRDTIGYLDGTGAHLFVSCPVRSGGDELLSVSVGEGGSGGPAMKDHAARATRPSWPPPLPGTRPRTTDSAPPRRTCRTVSLTSGEPGASSASRPARGPP
ncbi:hypothetical protein ACFQ0Q_17175 [Streptomyces aureus]